MDRHWAPQIKNLLQPLARVDRIFYVEDIKYLSAYIRKHGLSELERSPLGFRGARDRLNDYLSGSSIEKIQRIYAADFDMFGYSEDPLVDSPIDPIESPAGLPDQFDVLVSKYADKANSELKGTVDAVYRGRIAGWVRASNPNSAVKIRITNGSDVTYIPAIPDVNKIGFYNFSTQISRSITAEDMSSGSVFVDAILDNVESRLAVWGPILAAGTVSKFNDLMITRFVSGLATEKLLTVRDQIDRRVGTHSRDA